MTVQLPITLAAEQMIVIGFPHIITEALNHNDQNCYQ